MMKRGMKYMDTLVSLLKANSRLDMLVTQRMIVWGDLLERYGINALSRHVLQIMDALDTLEKQAWKEAGFDR